MSLSLREKQSLYPSLGQLLRSGITLPRALTSLAQTSSGRQRRLINRVNEALTAGLTLADALTRQRPDVSDLEIGVAAGVEKSGRLEHGMTQLSNYFGALAAAREGMLKKAAYPAFVLHFGVIMLSLPTLFFGGGLAAYLRQTLGFFVVVYGIVLIIALLIPLLGDAGAASALLDRLLRRMPVIGGIRRAFGVSRFCATYEMQLGAGINVIDALTAAQRASRSGQIRAAVQRAVPKVRAGLQVGPLLAASGAFPEPMIRALCVGEETGHLDEELTRLAAEYQAEALTRLDTATEWIPRLLYIGILLYIGYQIVTGYQRYLQQLGKAFDLN